MAERPSTSKPAETYYEQTVRKCREANERQKKFLEERMEQHLESIFDAFLGLNKISHKDFGYWTPETKIKFRKLLEENQDLKDYAIGLCCAEVTYSDEEDEEEEPSKGFYFRIQPKVAKLTPEKNK